MARPRIIRSQGRTWSARLLSLLPESLHELDITDCMLAFLHYYCQPFFYLQDVISKSADLDLNIPCDVVLLGVGLIIIGPLLYFLVLRYALLANISPLTLRRPYSQVMSGYGEEKSCGQPPETINTTLKATVNEMNDIEGSIHRPANLPAEMQGTNILTGLSTENAHRRRQALDVAEIEGETSLFSIYWELVTQDASYIMGLVSCVFALICSDYRFFVGLTSWLALTANKPLRRKRHATNMLRWYYRYQPETAIVLRDGVINELPYADLVMGDIIHVSEGNRTPADGKVVSVDGRLLLDQRALTGESLLVEKSVGHTCFATTRVHHGDAFLLVEATGLDTYIGQKISEARGTPELLPCRKRKVPYSATEYDNMSRANAVLLLPCVALLATSWRSERAYALVTMLTGLLLVARRNDRTHHTTNHATGAARLAKNGCIVQWSRLNTIDALAGIDVLLCGKTGVVTENWLTVSDPQCLLGSEDEIMTTACLSTGPGTRSLDPVDHALFRALKRFPRAKASVDRHRVVDSQTFNPRTKMMQSLVEAPNGARTSCSLGAPKAILELCSGAECGVNSESATSFRTAAARSAYKGLRSMGVACKSERGPHKLLGLISMLDPLRLEARQSFAIAKQLGVSIQVTTGDSVPIGEALTRQVGMGQQVRKAESVVRSDIETTDIFAECFPEDRLRILRALQALGHRVAATGDGLEDVTALYLADCAVAVEGSTIEAQGAADMVMIKPGISTLVDSIRVARQITQQGHNFVTHRVMQSLHVLLVMLYFHAAYGQILRVAPVLIWYSIVVTFQICLPRADEIPYSLRPLRWSCQKLLKEATPPLMAILLGTYTTVRFCEEGSRTTVRTSAKGAASSGLDERSRVVLLSLMITDSWLPLLINSGGRPWMCRGYFRQTLVLISSQIAFTAACTYGMTGHQWRMGVTNAVWAWGNSLLGLFTTSLIYGLLSKKGRVPVLHEVED